MAAAAIAIETLGLVTSVGQTAASACAAMRAKLTNPVNTAFIDLEGAPIVAHEVALGQPWRGIDKLARMGAMAIAEALAGVPKEEWRDIPLLLCIAERERPGRIDDMDDQLVARIEQLLETRFAAGSSLVAHGRVGVAVALSAAAKLLHEPSCRRVLVAATDSLISWPTLSRYERAGRLLTEKNSNGFMPGEGGGAMLLRRPGNGAELRITGIGFGVEKAHIDSEEPLRSEGLSQAIRHAVADAGVELHELDFRITDLSGEHFYFKEAALALSRTLRQRKEVFDIWHPAECTGETGAAIGISMLAVVEAACRKGYSGGSRILAHLSNDSGQRAAAVLQYQGPA